jgi:hypothetical protein
MSTTEITPPLITPQRSCTARGEYLRAARISAAFCAGLVVVLFAVDFLLGRHFARHHGRGDIIGDDVYEVVHVRALRHDDRITTLFLGDSVARQFYYPTHEPPQSPLRYLTSNQAIGVAGQYYLLRDALVAAPHTKRVFLLYTPRSFGNNLDPPLAYDYFCQFFHRPDEIAQVFVVKRDAQLTAVQIGRWMLPNLIAMNRLSDLRLRSPEGEWFSAASNDATNNNAASQTTGAGGESVLDAAAAVTRWIWPPPFNVTPPTSQKDRKPIPMSAVSAYFLTQIRLLCESKGIELRVIPCPCTDARRFIEQPTPFDAPIWYLPADEFRDAIHLKPEFIEARRGEFVTRYGLDAK